MAKHKAKLTVNVGGMFSGKTTELLRQGKRHLLAKDNVVYIKPNIDDRYSTARIVSHNGEFSEALVVGTNQSILCPMVKDADVILIDEVQFFRLFIVDEIRILLSQNKVIYVSGLDLSFDNSYFDVTAILMSYADEVNKFQAVCNICGSDAHITAKKGGDLIVSNERIDVGSGEKYIPVCRECYQERNIGGVINV